MGMNPQSVHQTKNKGEWLENERIQFKIQSRKAVDLAVKNLEFPDIPTKMTRLLMTVTIVYAIHARGNGFLLESETGQNEGMEK